MSRSATFCQGVNSPSMSLARTFYFGSHTSEIITPASVLLFSATLRTPLSSELKMLVLSTKIPCFLYCLASSSVVFRIGSGWFKTLLGQWPIRRHCKASVRLTYQLFCRERPPFHAWSQSKDLASLPYPYNKLNISIALRGVFEGLFKKSLFSALHFLISPSRVTRFKAWWTVGVGELGPVDEEFPIGSLAWFEVTIWEADLNELMRSFYGTINCFLGKPLWEVQPAFDGSSITFNLVVIR